MDKIKLEKRVDELEKELETINNILHIVRGRRIYHGGCHGCITDQSKCCCCQYANRGWELPNLYSEEKN